jgi:carboxypeptidase family protein/TonB-dependent receptor-like protein
MTSKRLLRMAALLAMGVGSLLAQSAGTGAITGTVTDASGAVVPNVTVTLTNAGTNQTRTETTGADGIYRFSLLEPGTYRARFSVTGFKTAEVTSITLNVEDTLAINRSLEVGSQTEQVTVEATTETLQTASSTVGTTVPGNTITAIPLSSRNFTQVLGMSAGVATDVNNGAAFGRGTANMSVNGASPEKNNFQVDGVPIDNAAGNGFGRDEGLYTGVAVPNPDAVQEFKIQTSTYDASYGRNPGANVNLVTKSGTNQLHGSLFEFFRNEKLNANDFFYNRDNPLSRTTKQALKQNQFGGAFGGPLKKDKIFFFGSYQGTRQRNGVAAQGFTSATLYPVPGGDRSRATFGQELGAAMCGFRPTRGMPIACDGSNINPVAIALLNVKLPDGSYYIPGSGTSGTAQRFFSVPAQFSEDQYLANVDWLATAKHTLGMRYMFSKDPDSFQLQGQLPGRVQYDRRANTSALLRDTWLVSSSIVNQARVSFQRVIQDGSETVPYTPQQVGIKPLIDIRCCNGTTLGTYTQPPIIQIGGAFNIGGALQPSFAPTNQTQYADQVSWTKGVHTLRAGYEFENIRYPLHFGGLGNGQLVTPSFADFLIGRAGCSASDTACSVTNPGLTNGSPLSNFSTCLFCVRSVVQGIIHNYHMRNMNTFFQDDWKVSRGLTVNIGVRWEYDGVLSDKYGNLTNLWASDLRSVPLPPSAPSTTDPKAYIGYVVPSNYNPAAHGPLPPGVRKFDGLFTSENGVPLSNFAPRVGFAWQPRVNGRLVVRGGAGLFYDRIGINRIVHAVQEGKPYADTTGLQNDIASLQSPFQDRPLAFAPRYFNFQNLTGSNLNSPFYDRVHTPLVRQYNLGFQYEFLPTYVLEAAFVGSNGINVQDYNHNINTAKLASPSNPINGITTNTAQNAAGRTPYLGFQPNGLQQNAFDGVYNYNSIQTTVRKQFSHGLTFQGAYTFSKNLSNVGYYAANVNYATDMWQQYGQTPYSRPHRFVLSYQYDLPFKSSKALGKAVEGWTIGGLTTIQSGNPLTIFDNRAGSAWGTPGSGTFEQGMSRAQMCPGKTYADIATSGNVKDRLGSASNPAAPRFFNASAFCLPPVLGADGSFDFGNSGVGIVRGPHQLNFDFQVSKVTRIRERQSLQFRAEFFNLFNHAQFGIPTNAAGGNPDSFQNNNTLFTSGALFGVINQTSVAPRLIQFALKYSF